MGTLISRASGRSVWDLIGDLPGEDRGLMLPLEFWIVKEVE